MYILERFGVVERRGDWFFLLISFSFYYFYYFCFDFDFVY